IIANFPSEIVPRRVYHGWVVYRAKVIDEVLYYYFKSPESYTGEDVIEISCHGGKTLLLYILDIIVEKGARIAERGEFTRRAFLNRKIDLTQAEAILDLINAKTPTAVEAFSPTLSGKLSENIRALRGRLIDLLATLEAQIDFCEDIESVSAGQILEQIDGAMAQIDKLLRASDYGRVLREGVRVAIIGKPNVGKSSLLNALLGMDRAIVTDEPGTTRDTIEEIVNINGLPIMVIDTAGLRHPKSKAEEFGVDKARREIVGSELVLVVIDASLGLSDEDYMVLNETRMAKRIIALNKIDLGEKVSLDGQVKGDPLVRVSALTGVGIDDLKENIYDLVLGGEGRVSEDLLLINSRHKQCLQRAVEALARAKESLVKGLTDEFIAFDIKEATIALGEVSGEVVSEEVINEIFEKFCVGK
ncbi:MAG: tRNA uridine-5-carboxymethylaminomethyl(34) synthesis GTPase MnmE, partial [Anaerolineales bacterium]